MFPATPLRSLRPPRLIAFRVLNVKCQVLKDVSRAECRVLTAECSFLNHHLLRQLANTADLEHGLGVALLCCTNSLFAMAAVDPGILQSDGIYRSDVMVEALDRKSTRLNSSQLPIS